MYRVYVTDSLMLAGQGKYYTERWASMIEPANEDNRSGDEIVLEVFSRAGLHLKGGETDGCI